MSSSMSTVRARRRPTAGALLLGGLVAVLALGVLSMHGLSSTADPAGPGSTTYADSALVAQHEVGDHDPGHGALGHLGAICLWLVIGGVVAFAATEIGRRLVRVVGPPDGTGSASRPTARHAEHGRAPPLSALGLLRC
jgi:hypothetical protein